MRYHFNFGEVFAYTPWLIKGALLTLELIGIGGVLGIALGIFGAWARSYGPRYLRVLFGAYVELIRNTPFLVQLFFIFFGLPRPALQKIWPALSSQVVIVMLGSAACSQIAVEDLSFAANFIQSRNFRAFESYFIATGIYLLLAILLRQVMRGIGLMLFPPKVPR